MTKTYLYPTNIDDAISMMERLFKDFEKSTSGDSDRFVSILISKPGVGKSATIEKMCKRIGYNLIDLNLSAIEPSDLIGLGAREKVDGEWQTSPALPQWAKKALEGNCIIFVDEFNNTTQDVLAGFQKMFSDFVIEGRKLPRTTHIIGACNPPGADALFAAKRLSGAFRRRLCMIPVKDDFSYVMAKHGFTIPSSYTEENYDDILKYIEYGDLSSAIIDNVFNISRYEDLTEKEKVVLISGFGSGAVQISMDLELLSDEAFGSGRYLGGDDGISYKEWKKNPDDIISEYQQILWGQDSIHGSVSYRNSKKFVSRIKNPNVYKAIHEILVEKFDAEYELDETKLPAERN